MNKLFNRGRNYKMLSLLMVVVMLFSLLPSNMVNAETQAGAYPTMSLKWMDGSYTDVSADYPEDLFAAKYTDVIQWSGIVYGVTNHDKAEYDQLQIDLTSSREGMALAVTDQGYGHVDEAKGWLTLSAGRQTVTLDLKQSVTQLAFQADANVEGGYVGTEEVTFIVHSVKFIKSETPTTPEVPTTPDTPTVPEVPENGVAIVLGSESGAFNLDADGRLYAGNGGKLRGYLDFPEEFRVEAGGKLTINYDTDLSSFIAEFTYGNGGNPTSFTENFTSGQNTLVINIDEAWVNYFAGNMDYVNNPTRARLKVDSTTGTYIDIISVTYDAPSSGNIGNEGEVEGGTTTDVPTVTGITSVSNVTDVTSEYEGALAAVRFVPAGEANNSFKVGVLNHDVTKYTKAVIEITPYREGMPFAVYNNGGCYSGWWFNPLGAAEKQTIEIDLTDGDPEALTNISELQFYLDNAPLDTTTEVDVVIHSIKLIDPNALVEPEEPVENEVAVKLVSESGAFEIDGQGRLYSAAGGKLRGGLDFPADFRVEEGGTLTINYDTDLPSFKAEFTYGNGGNATFFTKDFTSGQNSLVIDMDEAWGNYFAGNTDYANNPTRARLKVDSTSGTYIDITSVIYAAPSEDNGDSKPAIPSWQVNDGPTVTLDTASGVFACEVNDDKSVDVSFTAPAGWTALRANVENCDYTKYSRVKIDITPAEGLYLYVYGDVDGDISGKYDFDSAKRTTIEFDLKRDTTYFDLWCNPQEGMGTAGQKDFTIHSIKIVDPTMPEGEFLEATLSVESGAFTMEDTDTIRTAEGGKLRARITLPKDFRVEEGKQLTFYYDTNIDGLDVDFTWDWTDTSLANSTFKVDKQAQAFIIDQSWIDYINNNTSGTNPTVRLKLDSAPAGSYFTLKYVVYGDVSGNQYNPEQVPQGLVVTYYSDIYSRGVAWNTDNTVEENALYYVKATDGMTAENIDWTSADVQKVEATSKDTTDTTGKTWRTFKAHVENLGAESKYFYRAGDEETGWSEVGSFTIEKAKEDITGLSFIHVTDSQEESSAGFQKWARVLKDAYTRATDAAFVAHTGDIVNRSENKNNFYMNEWIYAFDEPMSQIMNGVLAPASGNHETLDYVFTDRFDIQWADYKEGDEELRYGGCYTVTYGEPENGLVLISLNNTAEAWNYDTDFKLYQQVWLVKQLEQYKDYKWKVVQLHEGLMTAGDHTTDGEVDVMRDELPPIFAKYKVDLVLQGHDHVYTRTRSYAYGVNVFEPGTEENPNYHNGHTPVWAETQVLEPGETSKDGSVTNTLDRTIYLEPQGTHYITINSVGTKQYPEEPADRIDEVIFEGDNPIHPTDESGNYGSMCQPGLPMYGIVTIEGDLLIYDSYTYDHNSRTSDLYDSFAVSKANKSGYDTENPHEGKEEVQLYGIKMESKTYDGYAPKLDVSGFIASDPRVMDVTAFKYTITSANDDGASYYQSAKGELFYGSNGKGIIPTQKGDYILTIEIPQSNRYFYGSTTVEFSIK